MDNLKISGRAALKIAGDEINELYETIRKKDEQLKNDGEFIKNLQAQIKILNCESYQLKSKRDVLRACANPANNQVIIWRGISMLMAVVLVIAAVL